MDKINNILEYMDMEEKIRLNKDKSQKKHYLNPNAKAFVNKFLKVLGK